MSYVSGTLQSLLNSHELRPARQAGFAYIFHMLICRHRNTAAKAPLDTNLHVIRAVIAMRLSRCRAAALLLCRVCLTAPSPSEPCHHTSR